MAEVKQIAKIERTYLGYEDHGIFSLNVSFNYGSSAQGTGHYGVCSNDGDKDTDAWGIRLVKAIVDACGVDTWEQVKGRTVYVIRDGDGFNAKIVGMEPLPTEKGKRFLIDDIARTVDWTWNDPDAAEWT